MIKRCKYCKKYSDNFSPKGTGCRPCKAEIGRKYRSKNREKILKMKKRYYYEGGGKEKGREWVLKNKDKLNAQWREKYKANPKKYLDKHKEYLKNNPEKLKEYKKREYWKYRDMHIKHSSQYSKKNREKINKLNKKYREAPSDTYIKKLLTSGNSLKHKDIPQELVEAKRQYVKIIRITKEK